MNRTTGGATVEVESPSIAQPVSPPIPVREPVPAPATRPARNVNRWLLVLMIVLGGTFAGAFARFVLYPAITTVAGVPADGAHADGP